MRRSLLLLLTFAVCAVTSLRAQVDVSTGGPVTSYVTLKDAFDAINAGTHTGTITIAITGNTTETAPAVLNGSGTGSASYTSITISPSGGASRTISGAMTAGSPLLDLNGADNVLIDGLNSGGNTLTFENTTVSSTSGTSTIRFIGDATGNTITRCSILGASTTTTTTNGGTIFFSTAATGGVGNDNNTISFCKIGPSGSNLPAKAIYGNGSTTSTAAYNSGVQILNNEIFDFFHTSAQSNGMYLAGGNTDWTISNNRLYQTGIRTQTSGATHAGIQIASSTGNNNHTISSNIIGYANASGTGTYAFVGANSSSKFLGIYFSSAGSTTASSIQGNTITAIDLSGTVGGTGTTGAFMGISIGSGLVTIGNITGNTIGSNTASGAISVASNNASSMEVYGIYYFPSLVANIQNNIVGGITATNTGAGALTFYGIRAFTSSSVTNTVISNQIGFTAAPINITATSTSSRAIGLYSQSGKADVHQNTVSAISLNAGNVGTGSSASMIGVWIDGTSATAHQVSRNTVFSIANSHTTAAVWVTGLHINGTTGPNIVERNFIHALTIASNSATATLNGINIQGGTSVFRNNVIAIGSGITEAIAINGINETVAGTDNLYHNSVYIGGSPTAGTGTSFAFQSSITVNTRNYINNIFYNARSNAGATGKNYAIRVGGTAPSPGGLTSNFNVLYAPGSGGFIGLYNAVDQATLNDWRTATGNDNNSFAIDPQYINPTAATPDLHIHPTNPTVIEANGTDVGVTDDFDGQTRASLTPTDIGADAGNFNGVDLSPPSIVYTPLSNTNSTSSRTLTATITDPSGVPTAGIGLPRLYWRINSGSYSAAVATYLGSNQYQFSFGSGVSVGDTVRYYIVAQDGASTPNVGASPSVGASGLTANPPAAATPPNTPSTYLIVGPPLSGDYTVGLTLYQSITGKTITFVERTREVRPLAAVAAERFPTAGKYSEPVDAGIDGSSEIASREERYLVPIIDGMVIHEPLYHELTPEERLAHSLDNSVVGIYPRITDAVNDLNLRGVSGNTRFLFNDALFDATSGEAFPLIVAITSTDAPSSSATVTFRPNTGVTTIVTGASSTGIFVTFSPYVTIDGDNIGGSVDRNLMFYNSSTAANSYVLGLFNGSGLVAKNCTVKNTIIKAGISGTTAAWGIILNASGGDYDNVVIQNNEITKVRTGIQFAGVTGFTSDNGEIANNTIGSMVDSLSCYFQGILVSFADNLTIRNNEIIGQVLGNTSGSGTATTAQAGISITNSSTNTKIRKNRIHDFYYNGTGGFGAFGIVYGPGSTTNAGSTEISNNFIYQIKGDGDDDSTTTAANMGWLPQGICVYSNGTAPVRIYHNTIHLSGATLRPNFNGMSACIGVSDTVGAGSVDIRNNILRNSMQRTTTSHADSGRTMGIWVAGRPSPTAVFSNLDDNNYVADGNAPRLGFWDNTFADLAPWQARTLGEANADTAGVEFVSTTDLHLTGSSLGNQRLKGTPSVGITDDIDSDSRDTQAPYVGADEASPALPVQLASFTGRVLPNNGGVHLAWRTLSEINNYGFYVQRRPANGNQWSTISELIPGHGTTNDPHDYSYVDTSVPSLGTYQYRLKQVDMDGSFNYSEPISITLGPTSVLEDAPRVFALFQNYPNPFNPSTEIKFSLENTGRATLEVFNLLGQKVATLFDDVADAGRYYRVSVNATNFASGMYIYRLQSGSRVDVKKMLLMK